MLKNYTKLQKLIVKVFIYFIVLKCYDYTMFNNLINSKIFMIKLNNVMLYNNSKFYFVKNCILFIYINIIYIFPFIIIYTKKYSLNFFGNYIIRFLSHN